MNRSDLLILAGAALGAWTVTGITAHHHGHSEPATAPYYRGPLPVRPRLLILAAVGTVLLIGTGTAMNKTGSRTVSGTVHAIIAGAAAS
jgi:hypothetical protein